MKKYLLNVVALVSFITGYSQNRYDNYSPTQYIHPSQSQYSQSNTNVSYNKEEYEAALILAMFLLDKIADIEKGKTDDTLFTEMLEYKNYLLQAIPKDDLDNYFNKLKALSTKINASLEAYRLRGEENESKENVTVVSQKQSHNGECTEFNSLKGILVEGKKIDYANYKYNKFCFTDDKVIHFFLRNGSEVQDHGKVLKISQRMEDSVKVTTYIIESVLGHNYKYDRYYNQDNETTGVVWFSDYNAVKEEYETATLFFNR